MTKGTEEAAAGLQTFVKSAAGIFAQHDSEIGSELAAVLASVDLPPTVDEAGTRHLRSMIREYIGKTDSGLPLDCQCFDGLHWRSPGFGKLPQSVSNRIAVAEIVGPDGMIKHDRIRFGVLFQAKGHFYPVHSHSAEELYFILAGSARWAVDESEPENFGCNRFIHHKSWQKHSIETLRNPVLAMWGWTGDIAASTYGLEG